MRPFYGSKEEAEHEMLAKLFDESFKLGKEVGEMLAGDFQKINMDVVRTWVMQAEKNMVEAVDAFTKRLAEMEEWAVKGWHQVVVGAGFSGKSDSWALLKSYGLPQPLIDAVLKRRNNE